MTPQAKRPNGGLAPSFDQMDRGLPPAFPVVSESS